MAVRISGVVFESKSEVLAGFIGQFQESKSCLRLSYAH